MSTSDGLDSAKSVPLSTETSFRIGGRATEYYEPGDVGEFASLISGLRDRNPFILGGGCNTLFPDDDFERPVLSTVRLKGLRIRTRTLRAESGVPIGTLIDRAIDAGLGGLESFVGIPGTLGGAIAMNAGGGGFNFGDRVSRLGLIDLETGRITETSGRRIDWGYRAWNLEGYALAWADLELDGGRRDEIRARAREFFLRKRRTQPLGEASAGCIFKNPPGHAAAALIDDLGLKGLRCGGARVSDRHANFIVNSDGHARAADVTSLIDEIRTRVRAAYDVELETEIVLPAAAP